MNRESAVCQIPHSMIIQFLQTPTLVFSTRTLLLLLLLLLVNDYALSERCKIVVRPRSHIIRDRRPLTLTL